MERENCRPKKDDFIPFQFNENQFSFSFGTRWNDKIVALEKTT